MTALFIKGTENACERFWCEEERVKGSSEGVEAQREQVVYAVYDVRAVCAHKDYFDRIFVAQLRFEQRLAAGTARRDGRIG